jgi:hypothetical protein
VTIALGVAAKFISETVVALAGRQEERGISAGIGTL